MPGAEEGPTANRSATMLRMPRVHPAQAYTQEVRFCARALLGRLGIIIMNTCTGLETTAAASGLLVGGS